MLFKLALKMRGDVQGKTIVDGYGGVGTFTLRMLRDGAKHVSLVECSPPACADARANLSRNGFENAGVLEHAFGTMPLPPCDFMVVDPPRAGLQEIGVRAIIKNGVKRVMLVSCSQNSLARDLAMLKPTYRVSALRRCELLPHTEHVEYVTTLDRNA